MRPPLRYFGGKIRLADRLVALMPAHRHYVEPFCGSLAVLLAKPRVAHETVNDRWDELMTFWRVLRERPEDLERFCLLTPHSRSELAAVRRPTPDADELEVARRVWVKLTQGRAGVVASGWRHVQDPTATRSSLPAYLAGYVGRMPPAVERLAGVSLECRPALDVIADYGRHREVLLYVDPPYLGSTRATRTEGMYAVEMDGDAAHEDLAAALLECRAAVMLSGYPSGLYDQLFAGWHRVEIPTSTEQGGERQDRTEVVWSNRPIGEPSLFDLIEEAS